RGSCRRYRQDRCRQDCPQHGAAHQDLPSGRQRLGRRPTSTGSSAEFLRSHSHGVTSGHAQHPRRGSPRLTLRVGGPQGRRWDPRCEDCRYPRSSDRATSGCCASESWGLERNAVVESMGSRAHCRPALGGNGRSRLMTSRRHLAFDGEVAIVTGAGNGLGRAHALELASRGARVVVNDTGGDVEGNGLGSSVAQAVVDQIAAAGGEAVADHHSVADPAGAQAIVQAALDTFGQLDIVVNNAGILRDGSFAKLTPDRVDPVFDVHLRGAFHVTRPAWEIMRGRKYGRIINTSSGSGLFGNYGQANYAAAKMGLIGLTRVLAIEGERLGIRVNAIAPIARSRMTEP